MADSIVELFAGKLGGGKTYHAVQRAYDHFKRGGIVYTNIALHWENIARYAADEGIELDPAQYVPLTNDQIKVFPRHIQAGSDDVPVLVIVDEAHLYFDSRNWKTNGEEVQVFVTQTRKVSVNIIFIAQSHTSIDNRMREKAQFLWFFRDMEKFKLPALGIRWPLPQFLRVCIDAQQTSELQDRKFVFKDKRVFAMYESKALLTDLHLKAQTIKPNVKKIKRRTNKVKLAIYIIIISCAILIPLRIVYKKLYGNGTENGNQSEMVKYADKRSFGHDGGESPSELPLRVNPVYPGGMDSGPYVTGLVSWSDPRRGLRLVMSDGTTLDLTDPIERLDPSGVWIAGVKYPIAPSVQALSQSLIGEPHLPTHNLAKNEQPKAEPKGSGSNGGGAPTPNNPPPFLSSYSY